jgi:tetratricopeptide (TPR) repeat protein
MAETGGQSGNSTGAWPSVQKALAGAVGLAALAGIYAFVDWIDPDAGPYLHTIITGTVALVLLGAVYLLRPPVLKLLRGFQRTTASGSKLTIVIATLNNDSGAHTRHVEESLDRQFGSSVHIIRDPAIVSLSDHGDRDRREQKAVTQAKTLLADTKGDVLIWGAAFADRNVVELRFLGKDVSDGAADAHRYALGETLLLPADFGADLGAAAAAVCVAAAAPAFDDGNYVVDLLRPAVRRLRHFVETPPSSLTGDARAQIFHAYALACQTIGAQAGENASLLDAVTALTEVLKEYTHEKVPLDWAMTQNNLGNALCALGERESGTARLEQAVTAYTEALKEYTREKVPLSWAMTQNNLGTALWALGERESGTARLEQAVTAYTEALKERTREKVPLSWATTQNNLGTALWTLGERESGTARLEQAVTAFTEALKERTREKVPLDWAMTQNNLGNALWTLGERESGTARLEQAVTAYTEALKEYTREKVPLDWAMTQNNLGNALRTLGERESGTARLEQAVTAYTEALKEYTREKVPLKWAMTQNNLGTALATLGERESGTARLEQAVTAYTEALKEYTRENAPYYHDQTRRNLARAEALLAARKAQKP